MGDEFVSKTQSYFEDLKGDDSTIKKIFDVTVFAATRFSTFEGNAHARFRNSLVRAIQQKATIPRYIALLCEDDLIKDIPYHGPKLREAYGKSITWILNEFRRIIRSFKEIFPEKAVRDDRPQFIIIQPTQHQNYRNGDERKAFGDAVAAIAPLFPNTTSLMLKQLWDPRNKTYYSTESKKFTAQGIKALWMAVDRTLLYGHKAITAKLNKAIALNYQSNLRQYGNQQFRRNGNDYNRYNSNQGFRPRQDYRGNQQRLMLPAPPSHR